MFQTSWIGVFKRGFSGRPDPFSRSPLNYELLQRRTKKFDVNSCPRARVPSLLIDYIKSNRKLQSKTYNHVSSMLDLGIQVPKSRMESDLVKFLRSHKQFITPDVLRAYMLESPGPQDAGQIIESIQQSKLDTDLNMVRLGINTLLKLNDYSNCFRLLDETISGPRYLAAKSLKIRRYCRWGLGVFIGINVMCTVFTSVPFIAVVIPNTVFGAFLTHNWIKIKFPTIVGRISWRYSTSVLERIRRSQELCLTNRIITHFEENNEINLMNYHTSQVRSFTPNILRYNDLFIEPPTSEELIATDSQDRHVFELQTIFKQQLNKRKMIRNDLPQELQFVEFFMSYGNEFEWVEPDQDPAEMANFRSKYK